MSGQSNRFSRTKTRKIHRKVIYVCGEGETECNYFNHLNKMIGDDIFLCYIKSSHSAPAHLLKRMKTHPDVHIMGVKDEAWLVVDRDQWTTFQFNKLKQWSQMAPNYHVAICNPKFEYWLLLHFDDGHNISSERECDMRLVEKMNISSIDVIKNPNLNTLSKFTEKM